MKTTILTRAVRAKLFIRVALAAAVAVVVGTQSGKAQNAADNVNNGASDLTLPASYSMGAPTSASDVTFTMGTAYSPSTFTLNTPGYNLSIGTLDDLSTTPITIQNANANAGSYSTITLNGGSNNTSGIPGADLLYVASGASLTIGGGSGGTLFLAAAPSTGNGNLDIVGSATIAGTLTGTATLSKTGAGTLDFSGGSLYPLTSISNSTTTSSMYTGGLTISAGAIELSNTNALEGASVTNSVANGLTFDSAVTSHTFDVGALSGAGNIALTDTNSNAVTLVLTENSFGLGGTATAGSYSGALSGGGSLVKEGSNTETLSGTNTYLGSTTVNGGTLAITGSLSSKSLALGGGTFNYNVASGTQAFTTTTVNQGASAVTVGASGETVNLGTVTRNADSALDFGSTGTIVASGLSNTNGIIGGWATSGGQTTFAVTSAANSTASGTVTGLATSSYTSSATAGTTASAYANANIDMLSSPTLTGTITPNAIRFNSSTAYTLTFATGTTNTIGSGGILLTSATSGSNLILGGTITSGTQELDITSAKGLRISSAIADNSSGAVAVVLNAAGNNINLDPLVGSNSGTNTYTGGTFVNSGNFLISLQSSAGTGTITLGANGSSASANLVANTASFTVANPITVNPGGTRQFYTASGSAPTFSGLITLVGGADLAVGSNGTGAITITGGVTGTGNLQIGSPQGQNEKKNTTISTGAVNINGTLSDFSGVDTTAAVNVSAAVTGNTAILQDGTNQLFVFTGTNTNTGATTISSGDLQLGGTASSTTAITIGAAGAVGSLSANSVIVDNGTLVIDRTGTVTQGTDLSTAGITGTGALALYGSGTTILTAANAYTGGTSILTNAANLTAGTLQLGNGGTTGSLSTSSVIVDNGTLAIDRSNTVTEGTDFTTAANFTGTGGLSQIGTGTTVLLGANGYAGPTTISAGALQLGNGATNGTLASTSAITDNASLVFDENAAVVQGTNFGAITGTGTILQEAAAVTLSGTNTFGGGLTIDTSISANNVAALGTGTITLTGTNTSTGLLTLTVGAGGGTLADAITVTGTQGTIVNNSGNVVTLSGTVTKNGTVLNLVGGTNPGTFTVSGPIVGTPSGSDLNVINTGVTLMSANSYNGPTSISGNSTASANYDVLRAGTAGALPTATVVTLGSTLLETGNAGGGPLGTGYNNILDLDGTAQTIAGLSSQNNGIDNNYVVNSNGSYGSPNTNSGTLTISTTAGTGYTFGGTVGGAAGGPNNLSVVVTGSGTQTFTGANTYTGGTTVGGGTLQAGNALALGAGSTANVTVSGGTLQGTVANVDLPASFSMTSGVLQISAPAGTATPGKFTLTGSSDSFAISGGTWDLNISGSNSDEVVSTLGAMNSFSIGGTSILSLAGDTLSVGDYTILTGFDSGSGQFSSITGYNPAVYTVTFDDTTTPGVGELIVTSATPEPTTWAMLLGGIVLLVAIQRRRRAIRV